MYEEVYRGNGEELQHQEYQRFIFDKTELVPGEMPGLILPESETKVLRNFFDEHEEVEVGLDGNDIIVRGWKALTTESDMRTYSKHREADIRFSASVNA